MKIENYIDHTFLKPDGRKEDIIKLCKEAKEYNFKAVCVEPCNIELALEHLKGSNIKIATVVGFPLGSNAKEVKVFETEKAIEVGADEIDMVINIGRLKDKDYSYVEDEIRAIVDKAGDKLVKVIIETALLEDEEKLKAVDLIIKAGADYVKTSTGFSTAGANFEDVKLLKERAGEKIKLKASGGIRDYETAKKMIELGADRLGVSAGVEIYKESIKDR